jgi:serine/threonine-protein kinase HipA
MNPNIAKYGIAEIAIFDTEMVKHAYVYYNWTLAGHLFRNSRRYVFVYDAGYTGPSIALDMPRTRRYYSSPYLFPYFSGLLPEGDNRAFWCRAHGIDPSDKWTMLTVLVSGDTIGAVNVSLEAPDGVNV